MGRPDQISRVGLFVDAAFRPDPRNDGVLCGAELSGFMRFAAAVGERFERFALIAREAPADAPGPWMPLRGIELLPLPHYRSLRQLGRVLAALPATTRRMWRALDDLDAVWVSGVNPLGLVLALLAGVRRRRIVLLIRQDSPGYFRSRLPSRRWAPLLVPLRMLDACFRLLGRRVRTTVVGAELAGHYGAPRSNVLDMRVTQLTRAQLAAEPSGTWGDPVRLLTVGRIEPEKNPLLAVDALAELNRGGDGEGATAYSLRWVGEGRLADAVRAAAEAAGIGEQVELPGFVAPDDGLLELYRGADAFVHVSLTEGVPGVILEAMGSGLPIVATDVGGVRDALAGGEGGLLVEPADADGLVTAVRELAADPRLRRRIASRALELAAAVTVERESERVAAFIAAPDRP